MKHRVLFISAALAGSLAGALPASAAISRTPAPTGAAGTTAACAMPGNGYGRMFPTLPAAEFSIDALSGLSLATIAPPEVNPTPEGTLDAEENTDIPAGYTYFGQFVDHDLTADDRPNDLTTPTPVSSLVNLRTPQLDLDSLYGSGPTASPQLYQADAMHMITGLPLGGSPDTGAIDLPRSANGRAVIADGRNDENRIVAGIHTMFIRFHNQTVDRVKADRPSLSNADVFTEARRRVVMQYQALIVNDFLPRIVGKRTMDSVLSTQRGSQAARLKYYTTCAQMPVEFSVAAYRFGHSMVRGLYRINAAVERLPIFSGTFGTPGVDLVGFSPSPTNFALDWAQFFAGGKRDATTVAQLSYKIDASLTHSLSLLPLPVSSAGPADLAKRNLLRSTQLGLPSGQDVARAMGVTPLRDDQILVGKATGDATEATTITNVSSEFAGKAPLWTYVMAEATANAFPVSDGKITGAQRAPFRLGAVGGRIVAETFVGLLASDPASILNSASYRTRGVGQLNQAVSIKELFDRVASNRIAYPRPERAPQPPTQLRQASRR